MNKIFIDLGGYDGDTIREFFNWGKMIGSPDEFIVYCFEPNPKFKKQLDDTASQHNNVIYSQKAAWTHDGTVEFAVDNTESPLGSTAAQSKRAIWDIMPHIQVECFDFSQWLKQFKDDYVIVKMDIEGGEFTVLEKMITDKTITIPAKLMVEFHQNKVQDYTNEDRDNLVNRIRDLGANLEMWH